MRKRVINYMGRQRETAWQGFEESSGPRTRDRKWAMVELLCLLRSGEVYSRGSRSGGRMGRGWEEGDIATLWHRFISQLRHADISK